MSTVTVDPRLRERRRSIARGVFRRRRGVLVLLVVLTLVAVAGWAVTSTSLLGVRQVQVRGADQTGVEAVLAAAGIEPGTPLVRLPIADVEARLEALPWVAEATVSRQWAGTVEVSIQERRAVVAVSTGGGWALSDLTGKVVAIDPAVPAVPTITGPLSVPLKVGGFLPAEAAGAVRVAAILPASLRNQVATVSWTGTGEVLLELTRGGVAELGRADDPAQQLISLATVLAAVPPGPLEIVDLRAASVPVVRSDDPPPPAEVPVDPAFPINGELPAGQVPAADAAAAVDAGDGAVVADPGTAVAAADGAVVADPQAPVTAPVGATAALTQVVP